MANDKVYGTSDNLRKIEVSTKEDVDKKLDKSGGTMKGDLKFDNGIFITTKLRFAPDDESDVVLGCSGNDDYFVGNNKFPLYLRGKGSRPKYNIDPMAMLSDVEKINATIKDIENTIKANSVKIVTLTGNIDTITGMGGSVDVPYPEGFDNANTVVIGFMRTNYRGNYTIPIFDSQSSGFNGVGSYMLNGGSIHISLSGNTGDYPAYKLTLLRQD